MPNNETDVYIGAAELLAGEAILPEAAPLIEVAKWVIKLYEFGKTSSADLAVKLLQQEVAHIVSDLDTIHERINELADRVKQDENLERVRVLHLYALELADLADDLKANPKSAPEVAMKAARRLDTFLTDLDLWNWTDVKVVPTVGPGGDQRQDHQLLPADFKTYPALAVYAVGLGVYLEALQLEAGGDRKLLLSRHKDQLDSHIENVSVRPDWVDLRRPDLRPAEKADIERTTPRTLPEKIRFRITCRPNAQHAFAENGKCTFTIVCDNVIARRTTTPRDVVIDMPAGLNVACTASPDLGWTDEEELVSTDVGIRVLSTFEKMMRQLRMAGTLSQQYVGEFGEWSRLQQQFSMRAYLAAGGSYLGGFPTFVETTQGGNTYGGTVFLAATAGERRDIPLAELGGLRLTPLSDSTFAEWMRQTNSYASRSGFLAGFPTGYFGDYGEGIVCPSVLITRDSAEWRDVYLDDLKVSLDDVEGRFRATHEYAVARGFVGGFPNLFHKEIGGDPLRQPPPGVRRGIVCGTVLIKPGYGEWQKVLVFRQPR